MSISEQAKIYMAKAEEGAKWTKDVAIEVCKYQELNVLFSTCTIHIVITAFDFTLLFVASDLVHCSRTCVILIYSLTCIRLWNRLKRLRKHIWLWMLYSILLRV